MKKSKKYTFKKVNGKDIVICEMDRFFCKGLIEECSNNCSKSVLTLLEPFIHSEIRDIFSIFHISPIKAKATCSGGDVFDESIGKDISRAKCDWKYHNIMSRKYKQILRVLKKAVKEIEKLKDFHDEKCSRIDEDIKRFYVGE